MVVRYPGRVISRGEEGDIVRAVQQRLNETGCGPVEVNGVFDTQTVNAVKLFQARFEDLTGRPLIVDGQAGSITWGAMFGPESVPSNFEPPTELAREVIEFAATQIGVMEQPRGSNRGPRVDEYLRSVGLDPNDGSFPWCVGFTYSCYEAAARRLGVANPHFRTGGVLEHWKRTRGRRIAAADAQNDPELIPVGSLFILSTGGGNGHTGIVTGVAHGRLVTIEGNTNDNGSREGIGVFRHNTRKIKSINRGFIDYSGA
jgi:hypothetical protein